MKRITPSAPRSVGQQGLPTFATILRQTVLGRPKWRATRDAHTALVELLDKLDGQATPIAAFDVTDRTHELLLEEAKLADSQIVPDMQRAYAEVLNAIWDAPDSKGEN